MKTKRTYTKAFRADAIDYVLSHPDLDPRQAAEHLDMPHETLYGWIKQYRRDLRTSSGQEPLRGNLTEEEKEIARLKRELRDTKDALEVLKKAISILGD